MIAAVKTSQEVTHFILSGCSEFEPPSQFWRISRPINPDGKQKSPPSFYAGNDMNELLQSPLHLGCSHWHSWELVLKSPGQGHRRPGHKCIPGPSSCNQQEHVAYAGAATHPGSLRAAQPPSPLLLICIHPLSLLPFSSGEHDGEGNVHCRAMGWHDLQGVPQPYSSRVRVGSQL